MTQRGVKQDSRINDYMRACGLPAHETWTVKKLLRMEDLQGDLPAQKARFDLYMELRKTMPKSSALALAVGDE